MNEDILSFIWRFQYFIAPDLQTDAGEKLRIRKAGQKNTNAGPDFSDSRVEIDGVEWIGCVEIHVKASDWFLHQHEHDQAYESVVLHVVWENDTPIRRRDGTLLPTLTLKGTVRLSVLERYSKLQDQKEGIPCSGIFHEVHELQKIAMLDRTLLERLERKSAQVLEMLQNNQYDWEEVSFQWLGQHFGFKLNDPAFLRLTQIVPLKIIQKHRSSLFQIEALLFGSAGLIPEKADIDLNGNLLFEDTYIAELRKEYRFLAAKYGLTGKQMEFREWKFLRLRPAGFPTIRMAQFARLLNLQNGLFSAITNTENASGLHQLFHLKQSEYWTLHFQFQKKAKTKVPAMGKDATDLLIINAAVPLLVAYSKQRQQPELLDRAIGWLSELAAENNRITREWEEVEMKVKTAADSQALIEWYHNYCMPRRCLECSVGAALLRQS